MPEWGRAEGCRALVLGQGWGAGSELEVGAGGRQHRRDSAGGGSREVFVFSF